MIGIDMTAGALICEKKGEGSEKIRKEGMKAGRNG
jgi:hypothetical protein